MIKYCCDMCKEEIENNKLIKTTLPLPQYVWAKDHKGTKLTFFKHSIKDESVDLCPECYTKMGVLIELTGIKSKSWDE